MREDGKSTRSGNASFAEEEFRRGVQSYYRGAYNESILEFEKALSYLPGEPLVLDWLGKAYYKSGIEGAALQQWNYAKDLGYGGLLLQNRIEIVSDRRITDEDINFVTSRVQEFTHDNRSGIPGTLFRIDRKNDHQRTQRIILIYYIYGICIGPVKQFF